jgi:hypothetical protein
MNSEEAWSHFMDNYISKCVMKFMKLVINDDGKRGKHNRSGTDRADFTL